MFPTFPIEWWRQLAVLTRDLCDPEEPRRKERTVGVTGPIVGRHADMIIMDDVIGYPRSDMVKEMELAKLEEFREFNKEHMRSVKCQRTA